EGCISVVANEVPKAFSDMVHMAAKGNFEKARSMHYRILDLMNVNFIETNPIPVKTALAVMGNMQESFRLPLVAMEPKNKDTLLSVLKGLELV
ncbi:MAG: dihydrodipicolinate synthase family protein, partial [Patescibacteria group bacterium]|nr:dihydrodipicolinate synthase family protein [Patescibacteria group bacterium]